MNKTKSKILNPKLWAKVKQIADTVYDKPSAYKSGYMVKLYKRLGGEYSGDKPKKEGLTRWFLEDWKNQKGLVGYQKPGDMYRPTKKITSKTPLTFAELTPIQIKKAQKKKKTKGRVDRFRL